MRGKKNGNDFLHLRAQFTIEIAFHLIQEATDSTEHLNKIKQKSFTFERHLCVIFIVFSVIPPSLPPSFPPFLPPSVPPF